MTTTLYPYPDYKPSGIKWLDKVPAHWDVRRLKGICRLTYGDSLPSEVRNDGYVPSSIKVGYEISFTQHFYNPQPLRPLEEIRADILALERETEGLLGEVIGSGPV